ncbi:hypothetical protein B0H12DRAFT_1072958 [Mycena haematopus]|nr:hypothetical protein B0H12DRAFT_1072958 [Mycena haematopus]
MVTPNAPLDSDAVPLYDLDEILANLSLDDTTPPPLTPSPPVTPVQTGARSVPVTPSLTSRTVYAVTSPGRSELFEDWSAAGSSVHRTPQSHVQAVRHAKQRGNKKSVAYVVFRGRAVGVFDSWPEAKAATDGVRFALHQGYPTREQATRAYDYAHRKGWTSDSLAWTAGPVPSAAAPLPSGQNSWRRAALAECHENDPCLECALNVLGIKNSLHEKVVGLKEARAKFLRAAEQGNVHIRLLGKSIRNPGPVLELEAEDTVTVHLAEELKTLKITNITNITNINSR